jgi:hypothetical protein
VNALTSNASLGGSMVPRCQVTIDTAPRSGGQVAYQACFSVGLRGV